MKNLCEICPAVEVYDYFKTGKVSEEFLYSIFLNMYDYTEVTRDIEINLDKKQISFKLRNKETEKEIDIFILIAKDTLLLLHTDKKKEVFKINPDLAYIEEIGDVLDDLSGNNTLVYDIAIPSTKTLPTEYGCRKKEGEYLIDYLPLEVTDPYYDVLQLIHQTMVLHEMDCCYFHVSWDKQDSTLNIYNKWDGKTAALVFKGELVEIYEGNLKLSYNYVEDKYKMCNTVFIFNYLNTYFKKVSTPAHYKYEIIKKFSEYDTKLKELVTLHNDGRIVLQQDVVGLYDKQYNVWVLEYLVVETYEYEGELYFCLFLRDGKNGGGGNIRPYGSMVNISEEGSLDRVLNSIHKVYTTCRDIPNVENDGYKKV